MSISRAQRARLTIFLIGAGLLFSLFLAISIGSKLFHKYNTYYAYFEGESLSGLDQGGKLKFRGLQIGFVRDISYNPNDLTRIKVEFAVKEGFPVKSDMVAQTGVVGITGMKYVELMGGSNEATLIPPGSEIKTEQSMMSVFADKSEAILEKIDNIAKSLEILTNADSLKVIHSMVTNVHEVTESINKSTEDLLPKVDTIVTSVMLSMEELQKASTDVSTITNKFVEKDNIQRLVNTIDSTIGSYQELSNTLNLTLGQNREDLASTMEDLKQTMENINELSQMLLDNPSLLLRGSPQRKRKIK